MNERIQELAEQAGFKNIQGWRLTAFDEELQQFAELLIEECCQMMLDLEIKYPANLTVREIKQHFGVE